jgi:competence protein ComEC
MRLLAETVRVWTRLPERISSLLITLPVGLFFHIYGLVLTSAVIQMGLTLPMVIYFHRSGLIGLLANAAVVPITTPIVPIGFLALITGSRWLAKLAALLLHWSQAVVEFSARLAPDWRVPTPPLWLAVAVAGFLIAAALVDRLRRRWSIPVWAGVAVLLGVLLWHPFPPKIAKNELELAAIDVGQGDSLLLGLPDGKVMIMDAGGIPTFGSGRPSRLDIGEDVVAPYLWTRSIRRIDVLALSHAHADHIGGVSALLEDFQVGELWTGALPDSETCRALLESARRKGVRVTQWRRGQHFDYGGARIEVLAPAADYVPSAVARNNDSLVLRLSLGKHSFLLSGDVERGVEDELWSQHLVGKTDVLKVAHHGSRTSSSAELLDALDPAIALISTGSDNSYGHPNREVLERLEERNVEVFRTDRNGMISVRSNGQRLSVEPVHWNHVSRD